MCHALTRFIGQETYLHLCTVHDDFSFFREKVVQFNVVLD